MKDNIRQAFDQVHADPALKARTRAFVAAQTQPRLAQPARRLPQVLAAAACLLVLLAGSYWIYFFPHSPDQHRHQPLHRAVGQPL